MRSLCRARTCFVAHRARAGSTVFSSTRSAACCRREATRPSRFCGEVRVRVRGRGRGRVRVRVRARARVLGLGLGLGLRDAAKVESQRARGSGSARTACTARWSVWCGACGACRGRAARAACLLRRVLSIGGRGGGEAVVDASDAARRDRRLLALEYEAGRIPRLRQRLPTSLLTERRARELKGLPRCTHGVRRTALPSDQCGPTLVRKTGLGVLCGSMSMVSIERSSGDGSRPPSRRGFLLCCTENSQH